MKDYIGIANKYAEKVVTGEIPACVYVKQACQRQINDLNRKRFKFKFDEYRASHICKFIELLPHIKGKWARERRLIELEPWQIFILTTVFGWVDKNGNRRFRTAYEEVPRKNAKSTKTSGIGLYLTAADGEEGAEVYSAATTRDQAKIVWQDAKRMADRTPGLQSRFGVETSANSIYVEHSASSFKALSRDQGGNHDGQNVHGGLIDELHAHKTREIFDVMETGTGAREQALLWLITTAGSNRSGVCYEQRSYAIKVLSGAVKDETYFGIIYTIDEGDDWSTEIAWKKANPNYGISVSPEDIQRKAKKAMEMASAQNNFLTKHLNIWVNADTAWMNMPSWDLCADKSIDMYQYQGKPCYFACDLASKTDIASIAILFDLENGEYAAFFKHYLNEEALEYGSNSQYSGWEIDGHIISTPGNVTDFTVIEDDIKRLNSEFNPKEVLFDPFQAQFIMQRLTDESINVVEYPQTVKGMSEPMKELEAIVLSKKLKHSGDPVTTWMVSNVVAHVDVKENIYPRKEFSENKIDGVVALIMALGRARLMTEEENLDDFIFNPVTIG